MFLTGTEALEIVLAGAVSTTQLDWWASFANSASDDSTSGPQDFNGQTNSTTVVSMIAAPASGVNKLARLSVFNADTAAATVSIRGHGAAVRLIKKARLLPGDTLHYEMFQGWYVADGAGAIKTTSNAPLGIFAGTNSFASGTVSFSNANNFTFGMDTNSNITASFSQSANTLGGYASGNTTGQSSSTTIDVRSISVDGAGGISVGYSAGSLVISGPQTAAQTNQTIGGYAVGNTTGQSTSTTLDARSMSFDGAGGVSIGYSGGSIVVSGPQTVAQTNQTLGGYAVGNTTGQSTSTTLDARTLSFDGAGGVSVGYSAGSIVISGPQTVAQTNQTIGGYAVGNTTGQSTSTTFDARSMSLDGAGGVSVGYSGGSVVISGPQTVAQTNQTEGLYAVGNTTAQSSSTTVDARSLSIQGTGGVSVGMSNGSLVISGGAGGGGGAPTINWWHNNQGPIAAGALSGLGSNQLVVMEMYGVNGTGGIGGLLFPGNMTVNTLGMMISYSMTTTSGNNTAGQSSTISLGFYTLNGNTLSLLNSGTSTWGFAAASDMSSKLHGPRHLTWVSSQFSANLTFSQTNYWLAYIYATGGTSNASVSFVGANFSAGPNQISGTLGTSAVTSSSMGPYPFAGGLYTAATGAFPASIGLSDLQPQAFRQTNLALPLLYFNNQTSSF